VRATLVLTYPDDLADPIDSRRGMSIATDAGGIFLPLFWPLLTAREANPLA
jgi:hypothetical protein